MVQPELWRYFEVMSQMKLCISSYSSFAVNNFIYTAGRDADVGPNLVLTQIHWNKKFLKQDFTGMYEEHLFHIHTS